MTMNSGLLKKADAGHDLVWRVGGWLLRDGRIVPAVPDEAAALRGGAISFVPAGDHMDVDFWSLHATDTEKRINDFMRRNPPPEKLKLEFHGKESAPETMSRIFASEALKRVINQGGFFDKPSITHYAEGNKTLCGRNLSKWYQPTDTEVTCKRCLKKAEVRPKEAAAKLSPTQLATLARMKDQPIFRFPGGFWIVGKPAGKDSWGVPVDAAGEKMPSVSISTVRGLESRGLVERANKWPEEWRDERIITPKGLEALQTGRMPKQADMKLPEGPVSKEYDAVRHVYQRFVDYDLDSVSWKDFQKHFQQFAQKYPQLFTEVRHNRPQITQADLKEWLDSHKPTKSHYELAETSFGDVEQAVLQINANANAQRILGEDPVLREYVEMVSTASQRSGHPAAENTVGWLRLDFVDEDWLLVDEVQSDLVNSVSQAKSIVTEPSFDSFMEHLTNPKLREKVQEEGITPAMFNAVKRQLLQKGYTPEKLDQIKERLVALFKDWAEYGIATLVEIARKHGIKNVAIHTAETIAQRDESVTEAKIKIYYDNLARSFGFRKQPLDLNGLKGNFWVRTAAKKQAHGHERFSKVVGTTTAGTSRDGKWSLRYQVRQDPDTAEKLAIAEFKSKDGQEVTVSRLLDGPLETHISSSAGDEMINGGTPRTHGSAVNNYLKKNFGFQWPFRPMHPFHQEPKKPYWQMTNAGRKKKDKKLTLEDLKRQTSIYGPEHEKELLDKYKKPTPPKASLMGDKG